MTSSAAAPLELSTPRVPSISRAAGPKLDRGIVALVLVLIVYLSLLLTRFAPAVSEPDDNGYFAQGTLLVTSGHTWFKPQSDAQYIGMHWLITPGGGYISRYPPGLAVAVGLIYLIGGYKAAVLVNPMISALALIGSYLLGRRLTIPRAWSIVAVIILAANPIFVHHALGGDSHMAVTCCLVWGIFFLVRWSNEMRLRDALLAGIVLGCIPTIRYPDAVMAAGIAVFILAHARRVSNFRRHLLAACAGAAIPIVPLLVRNQVLLGAFWRTGYALTNEQTGFAWSYFREHALQYIELLNSGGLGLMFALGIIGVTCMICSRPWRPVGLMIALIALPMLLLYMAYYWAPQMAGATMRFLLPTFPPLVIAGVWLLVDLTRRAQPAARVAVPVVVVIVQLLWGSSEDVMQTARLHDTNRGLAIVTDALEQTTHQGDVVIANPQILQDLDFVRHWKLADASLVSGAMGGPGGGLGGGPGGPMRGGFPGGPMGGIPPMPPPDGGGMMGPDGGPDAADAPSPMQAQKRDARRTLYPGSTSDRRAKFTADVRAWAGSSDVYIVASSEAELRDLVKSESSKDFEIVKRITMPAPARGGGGQMGNRFGGPGGGGAGRGRGGFGPMRGGPGDAGAGTPFDRPQQPRDLVIARWKKAAAA